MIKAIIILDHRDCESSCGIMPFFIGGYTLKREYSNTPSWFLTHFHTWIDPSPRTFEGYQRYQFERLYLSLDDRVKAFKETFSTNYILYRKHKKSKYGYNIIPFRLKDLK